MENSNPNSVSLVLKSEIDKRKTIIHTNPLIFFFICSLSISIKFTKKLYYNTY